MTTVDKKDKATKILKGPTTGQINTLDSLLNRAIKFRKTTYVDEKLEQFKRKFAPINGTTGVVMASVPEEQETLERVDRNGFELPEKVLFKKSNLQLSWSKIRPIGAGLSVDLDKHSALNAVLQALTYTPVLSNYLMSKPHSSSCNFQGSCIMCAFEEHVKLCASRPVVSPRAFVGKIKKMKNNSAQDPYAILNYLLDDIQKTLLMDKGSQDKRVQETTALHHMFGGYIQSHVVCDGCKKETNTYNSFLNLSVDITQYNTVERCLSQLTHQRQESTHCPSCKADSTSQKQNTVYRPPMILALRLQRFEQGTKIEKAIKFEEVLDISRLVTKSEKDNVSTSYSLYAVICHEGTTMDGGRHTAYVKSSGGIWYCLYKDSVQQVSAKRVLNQKAYMLFYTATSLPSKRAESTATPAKISKGLKPASITNIEEELRTPVEAEPLVEDSSDQDDVVLFENDAEIMEREEEKEQLEKALEAAAAKPKVENDQAITVAYNETMESKRSKLEALIQREMAQSKSAEAKAALMAKAGNTLFVDDVARWDEDIGSVVKEERNAALKSLKTKRKRVDTYDIEYDRGKVKKVKKKNHEKFQKPNMFQQVADTMRKTN